MLRRTTAILGVILVICSQLNFGICQTSNNESDNELVVQLIAENTKLKAEIQNMKSEIESLKSTIDEINRKESPSHLPPAKVEV